MKGEKLKEKRVRIDKRSRCWCFLLYPESLPGNWVRILEELCVPIAISPLHDKDVYFEDTDDNKKGELKKPHYHGVMCFDGKKSFSQVSSLLEPLNCPIPQVCSNYSACVRYFIHYDNPQKAQYRRDDIIGFSGINIDKAFLPNGSEEYAMILNNIYRVIRENEIKSFDMLVDCIVDYNPDWLPVVAKYSYFLTSYLNKYYKLKKR